MASVRPLHTSVVKFADHQMVGDQHACATVCTDGVVLVAVTSRSLDTTAAVSTQHRRYASVEDEI